MIFFYVNKYYDFSQNKPSHFSSTLVQRFRLPSSIISHQQVDFVRPALRHHQPAACADLIQIFVSLTASSSPSSSPICIPAFVSTTPPLAPSSNSAPPSPDSSGAGPGRRIPPITSQRSNRKAEKQEASYLVSNGKGNGVGLKDDLLANLPFIVELGGSTPYSEEKVDEIRDQCTTFVQIFID
ncbi:hypothetical protein V2J09_009257 [Rumex salicifolius]